jgi:AcrR family transcriptional regulator
MPVRTSSSSPRPPAGKPRKRLQPEERKHTILQAARKVFSKSGDPTAATVKSIASAAGISEGIIYRHFESKDQLYFEAIVEPLTDAIAAYVHEAAKLDPAAGDAARDEIRRLFWRNLITSLKPNVPLLGLVMFGEPNRARRFYRTHFTEAVDALAERWTKLFAKGDPDYPSREVAVSVLGLAIMFSVDARFNADFDLEHAVSALERITRVGFWPEL